MQEKIGMYLVASAQFTKKHMQERRNENFWSCISILNSIFPHTGQKGRNTIIRQPILRRQYYIIQNSFI